MPRRPLPINTWGEIKTKQIRHKCWEAHARYRHDDGVTRQHRRTGTTADGARNNLTTFFSELAGESGGEIDRDTRIKVLCEGWFSEFSTQQAIEGKSPATARNYRKVLDRTILPRLGERTARELKARNADKLIQKVASETGSATADSTRTVLRHVCLWAIRQGAMDTNPMDSIGRINGGKKAPPKGLTRKERIDLLAKLEATSERKRNHVSHRGGVPPSPIWQMLPDYKRALMATGCRPSEVLALSGKEVEPDDRLIRIEWHLVIETGGGVLRMPGRKGGVRNLMLTVPSWSVDMWRELKEQAGDGPLFPLNGLYPHPNTWSRIHTAAMREIGYGWVTSKSWRKTVALDLDEAGQTTTEIADQLGNTPRVVEQHYRPPRSSNMKQADALEMAWSESDDGKA